MAALGRTGDGTQRALEHHHPFLELLKTLLKVISRMELWIGGTVGACHFFVHHLVGLMLAFALKST
jgi:hypothetical protein